jgi:hypothetical protein
VLSKEGNVFRFYSRLDPNWGDLPWSGRLPVLLGALMLQEEQAGRFDRRVLDVAQIRPVLRVGERRPPGVERVDLGPAIWVLVLVIFLLERIKANQYGKA